MRSTIDFAFAQDTRDATSNCIFAMMDISLLVSDFTYLPAMSIIQPKVPPFRKAAGRPNLPITAQSQVVAGCNIVSHDAYNPRKSVGGGRDQEGVAFTVAVDIPG